MGRVVIDRGQQAPANFGSVGVFPSKGIPTMTKATLEAKKTPAAQTERTAEMRTKSGRRGGEGTEDSRCPGKKSNEKKYTQLWALEPASGERGNVLPGH
jgi:hypothetical protein